MLRFDIIYPSLQTYRSIDIRESNRLVFPVQIRFGLNSGFKFRFSSGYGSKKLKRFGLGSLQQKIFQNRFIKFRFRFTVKNGIVHNLNMKRTTQFFFALTGQYNA